jgi:hypothetical protein
MATLQDPITFARRVAQTDSNGLTDAKAIEFANEALVDFHREMVSRGVDASQVQESYQSATADTGTYLYPDDMFFLKAIECNYSDTSTDNYVTAEQMDVSNLAGDRSFSWLRKHQSHVLPLFDDRGDWFEIFPTPTSAHNVTDLLRIFYFLEPTPYTATTDTLSYPVTLDSRILGWRIASTYLKSLGSWESAVPFDQEYEKRINQLVKTLSRGVQSPMKATVYQDTGWQY